MAEPQADGIVRRPGGTFGIPAVLAVASEFALVAGLLGDGAVDVVAWIGLALPLIVTARAVWHPRPPGR